MALFFASSIHSLSHATEPVLFKVEEDWEMVINQADVRMNSPQIAFFIYPDAEHADCYFQLQMNYAAEDKYSSGGFRVGAFCNEVAIDEERSRITENLAWSYDRIRWTSAMAIFDGKLMFALKDGLGYQWGPFGGPEYLVEMDDQEMHALDHYTPQASLKAVDIGFGSNRVASIKLRRVRLTYTDGSIRSIEINQFVEK
ncbi:hypothetical protein NHH03_26945 [Stieleria sp. TO1_6]|nr:hypothetical protein [Stieleria tagensis]